MTTKPDKTEVLAVLVDDAVLCPVNLPANMTIAAARDLIADDLEKHVTKQFHLRPPIRISRDDSYIAGVEYTMSDTIEDIAKRLPPNSYPTFCFVPLREDEKRLSDSLNDMAFDQARFKLNADESIANTDDKKTLIDIYQKISKLEEEVESVKKKNKTLEKKLAIQDGVIAALKAEISSLKADNDALKADNNALKADNATLRLDLASHATASRKILLRILLDFARNRILEASAYSSWIDLQNDMTVSDFRAFIKDKNIFTRELYPRSVDHIYDGRSTIRQEGNYAAHVAEARMIRDAINESEGLGEDRHLLKNIYAAVFDCDI